ncbi:MAG: hypothetical protein AB1750_11695 [Chloroflexota bacterium]
MKRNLFLACLLFSLAACVPPTPAPAPGGSPVAATATLAANPVVTEAAPETAAPIPVFSPAPSFIQILSPLDGSVVNTQQVEIVGAAPVGAVVSVNDAILIVGADGQFKAVVALEEGPNVIEIIASLASGEQTYLLFSLFYEP